MRRTGRSGRGAPTTATPDDWGLLAARRGVGGARPSCVLPTTDAASRDVTSPEPNGRTSDARATVGERALGRSMLAQPPMPLPAPGSPALASARRRARRRSAGPTGRRRGSPAPCARPGTWSPASTPPTRASSARSAAATSPARWRRSTTRDVDVFVTGVLDPAVEARLRRAGYAGPVHGVLPAPADALPPDPAVRAGACCSTSSSAAAERSARRRRRRRAHRAPRGAGDAGRARPLRARLRCRPRLGEARPARTKRCAPSPRSSRPRRPDAALRLRARFHLGRLCYERGDHAAAREHLDRGAAGDAGPSPRPRLPRG